MSEGQPGVLVEVCEGRDTEGSHQLEPASSRAISKASTRGSNTAIVLHCPFCHRTQVAEALEWCGHNRPGK